MDRNIKQIVNDAEINSNYVELISSYVEINTNTRMCFWRKYAVNFVSQRDIIIDYYYVDIVTVMWT